MKGNAEGDGVRPGVRDDDEFVRREASADVSFDEFSLFVDMSELDADAMQAFEAAKHRKRSRDCLEQTWPIYRNMLKSISYWTHVRADTLNNYLRTIFFLVLLGLLFPFNLCFTLLTILFSFLTDLVRRKPAQPERHANSKRILISGGMMTKALQLSRAFHQAGHRVILVDDSINWLTGHRWSKSVERFYVVPSPEKDPDAYIGTLSNIVQREKIDMFVPVTGPYHAHIDAQVSIEVLRFAFSFFTVVVPSLGLTKACSPWLLRVSHDRR